MVGLDVAGIDFICPDIASPVRETGGAIVEVNAAPGFRMHTHPTVGVPQFIAKPVVDLLFPPGAPSRVPIVAVTGTNGKTTTSRMIAHIFKGLGRKVGMTSTDGVVIDERLVIKADASGPKSARMVLQNPRVDFAVMEVARGGILREGLGYDRNDVAVVTNVAPDHLGLGGIDTLEQLANVKAVIVEAVPRDGFAVLNCDDPLVRQMRRRCSGDVIWFSLEYPGSDSREFIERHCRRGGRAVVLEQTERGDMIVIKHGRRTMQLAWTHLLPATFGGAARFNVANALAATGAAFAAGAPLHDIRQGLRTFTTNYYLSPGRMNLVNVGNVEVFIDYCHNAAGMRAIGDFVENYTAQNAGRQDLAKSSRIGMIGSAGDRRDDDMRELGSVAAQHFDVIVIREDDRLRGRKRGVTAELIAEGVRSAMAEGARCRQVEVVLDEIDAVNHVWRAATRATSSSCASTSTPRSSPSWRTGRTAPRPGRTAASWSATPTSTRPSWPATPRRRVRRPRSRPSPPTTRRPRKPNRLAPDPPGPSPPTRQSRARPPPRGQLRSLRRSDNDRSWPLGEGVEGEGRRQGMRVGPLQLGAFDVDVGQDPVEPPWQPPRRVAGEVHDRRDEQHPDHERVDEDPEGQPEPERPDGGRVREHEPGEDRDHDDRRRRDDDATRVEALLRPPPGGRTVDVRLTHTGDEEQLVVHGQPEEDPHQKGRQEAEDRSGLRVEHAVQPPPLEDRHDAAERGEQRHTKPTVAVNGTRSDRKTRTMMMNDRPTTTAR